MNDILLYKDEFFIKNNSTPKNIPFLWNGKGYPKLVHVSNSEIPSTFEFNKDNAKEGNYPVYQEARDDWNNLLGRDDFYGNYLLVDGVEQSEIIDQSAAQSEPFDGEWDVASVSKVENSENLKVTRFDGYSAVSESEQKVYMPEKYGWNTIRIQRKTDGNLEINYPESTNIASEGIIYVEPCERRWTRNVKLSISYDYPYLIEGTYDIEVSLTSSTNDSEINRLPGLYRILDETSEDIDRIWCNHSNNRAIAYNSSSKCWQIIDYDNLNLTNKTVRLNWDRVRCYQYANPLDMEWLFGIENTVPEYGFENIRFESGTGKFNTTDRKLTYSGNDEFKGIYNWKSSNYWEIESNLTGRCLSRDFTHTYVGLRATLTKNNNFYSINFCSRKCEKTNSTGDWIEHADCPLGLETEDIYYEDYVDITTPSIKAIEYQKIPYEFAGEIFYKNGYAEFSTDDIFTYFHEVPNGTYKPIRNENNIIIGYTYTGDYAVEEGYEGDLPDRDTYYQLKDGFSWDILVDSDRDGYADGIIVKEVYWKSRTHTLEFTESEKNSKNITSNAIGFYLPNAGTIVNKHTLVEATPVGNWQTGRVIDGGNDTFIVRGTAYRELSKNIVNYTGSWSNGINVLENSDGTLNVYGFSDEDVNGTYSPSISGAEDTKQIWLHFGKKSGYSISYDTYWKLCTSADGVYTHSRTNDILEYNTWACVRNGITNTIYFSRYDNRWHIKSTQAINLTFYPSTSDSPLIGNSTVWSSYSDNVEDKEYYLRYDANHFIWKIYDVYDNVISAQMVLPTFWTNNAVVSWGDHVVTTEDELSSGEYDIEPFDTSISTESYKKVLDLKNCYLVYDLEKFGWFLKEKLNINGTYEIVDSNVSIPEMVWKLNGLDSSYRVVWGRNSILNSGENQKLWKLEAYNGVNYDESIQEPQQPPEPDENIWGNGGKVRSVEGNLIVSNLENYPDANGTFVLEVTEPPSFGTARVFSYNGSDGKYSILYDTILQKWVIRFYDTFVVSDQYEPIDDTATGAAKSWVHTATNECDYTIRWDNSISQWILEKSWQDNRGNIRTETLAYSNAIGDPRDNVWSSGCSTILGENNILTLMNYPIGDETPDYMNPNGRYQDDNPQLNGVNKTWSMDRGVSIFTVFFDATTLKWSLKYRDLDFNGEYRPQGNEVETNRVFQHTGSKDNYFMKYNNDKSGWEITTSGNVVVTEQTTGNTDPCKGVWQMGNISDPFAGTYFCGTAIPFTLNEDIQYNYNISGNSDSSYQKYNASYEIMDIDATGSDRLWKSKTGCYIKYVGDRWVVTDDQSLSSLPGDLRYNYQIAMYSQTNQPNIQNLSELNWTTCYYTWESGLSFDSAPVPEYGSKTFWMAIGDYEEISDGSSTPEKRYYTSNIVKFLMTVQPDEITNVSLDVVGSSGSRDYTGFYRDSNGRFTPTDLVQVAFSAAAPIEIRVKFTGGLSIENVDFLHEFNEPSIVSRTGILTQTVLGGTDSYYPIVMTVQDIAGNVKIAEQNITHIARLWRLIGTNIKEDGAGYQTRLFSVQSTSSSLEIPKSKTAADKYTRQWEDIFYPETHGYPKDSNGNIDYDEAVRISKTLDETGKNGPTTEELTKYDQLQLTNDKRALAVDSDDRYMTSGWQRNKTYSRMESSSYGEGGENLRYWIIDNTGYTDLKLEFEYFDLDNQISSIPPNILSPYEGDVLVVYDAQAEGCLEEVVDAYGKKTQKLKDSSLLVELFAFSGSCYTEDIKMKSGAALPITQTGNGFTTSAITTTSKICIILYSDNDYQGSGFKIKAGPRHNAIYYNYDMNHNTGEAWIHQEPGTTMNRWYSPSKASSTHQYMTANVGFDFEKGILTLDSRSGATITGDFTVYNYLFNDGSAPETPKTYFAYGNNSTGGTSHPELKKFLLYNDDCVDYYEVTLSVMPEGVAPNYSNIYSFQNSAQNFGKIVSNFEVNKDKGTINFTETVPLGRIFASYTYHSYYRLTNDGYGDLYFYDNALVPSADYSTTGLKDWTYVDLMIYNEGSNSLSEGIMKFMSRGYIEGSGSSQTVTQVVDENRPWDVQSGTIAETVNRTGASFSVSYNGLAGKTRGAAVNAINNTSSGGVSLGSTMLPRSKAYIRLYWCLATSDSSNPSYVVTTRGKKLWSSELSGKYFVVTV